MSSLRNKLPPIKNTAGMCDTEFGLAIQRGLIPDVSVIHKFGRNPLINSADGFETLWNGGGSYTGFDATAPEIVEVFSSDANDNIAGTGARVLELRGLTTDFVMATEVVQLNGATPVDTINTFIRMDRALVLVGGTTGFNEGNITVRQKVTTANIFAVIPIGHNRTLIAAYTVPFGKVAYVTSGFASLSRKQATFCDVRAHVRFPGSVFQVVEYFTINSSGSSYVERVFRIPLVGVPAGSDIFLDADSSANDVGVSGGFEIILVDIPIA